jgi:hypothetical protein
MAGKSVHVPENAGKNTGCFLRFPVRVIFLQIPEKLGFLNRDGTNLTDIHISSSDSLPSRISMTQYIQ